MKDWRDFLPFFLDDESHLDINFVPLAVFILTIVLLIGR